MMSNAIRLLIADDDEDFTDILSRRFTRLGFSVTTCGNAGACVESFAAAPPDVALLDARLPGNEGFYLVRKLREMCTDVPLVMLSGNSEGAFIAEAMEAGVERYLVKPCSLADLQATLVHLLKREEAEAAVPRVSPAGSCP